MNKLEYTKHPARSAERMETINLHGKQIGVMRCGNTCGGIRYHAILYVHTPHSHNGGLAQADGKTREEAINNALDKNRKETEEYLQSLTALDQRIRGEQQ